MYNFYKKENWKLFDKKKLKEINMLPKKNKIHMTYGSFK